MKIVLKKKQTDEKFYDYSRDGITQGLLGMWQECRQKARFFLQGYSSKGSSMALTYGSVGHGVLEHTYENFRVKKISGAPSKQAIKKYIDLVEVQWKKENPKTSKQMIEDLEMSLAFAEVIAPRYFEHWKEDFKKKQWQKVEGSFKVPLVLKDGRKTFLRGKRDGVFKAKGLWLFESKFKSLINEADIIDTLPIDIQVLLYLWSLWKVSKEVPAGVLYNVVRRFGLKQKKNETLRQFATRCEQDVLSRPEWYFYRFEVAITKSDLEKFEQELHAMVKDFCDWCDGKVGHYRNSGSCVGKYGRCWCLGVCSGGDMSILTKRKTVFRELEDL